MTTCLGIYARLSPRPDGSYEGVDEQVDWGREYGALTWPGIAIRIFRDEGLSAAKDDVVRPGFEDWRAAIKNGELTHLWAVEQSRVERREGPWFTLAAEIEAAGISELHTRRDGIVKMGDVVAGIKAVLNANEIRVIKARVKDKHDSRAAKGVPPGALPFGYKVAGTREQRTYEIVPEQAKTIRFAAECVLLGWSLARIVTELRKQGVVSGGRQMRVRDAGGRVLLDDGRWVKPTDRDVRARAVTRPSAIRPHTIRSWLTNPSVAGQRVHRGEITGKGNWEPVLDYDTWLQVRAILAGPRVVERTDGTPKAITAAYLAIKPARKYLITGGLARCGVCAAPLIGTRRAGYKRADGSSEDWAELACHPSTGGARCVSTNLTTVEEYVVDELFRKLEAEPGFADALASDQHAGRRAELIGDLDEVHADRVRWARDAAARRITEAEWTAMRPELDERERTARDELAMIPAPPGSVDWRRMRAAWGVAELDEKRAFLRRYISAVTLNRAAVRGRRGVDPGRRAVIGWREA